MVRFRSALTDEEGVVWDAPFQNLAPESDRYSSDAEILARLNSS